MWKKADRYDAFISYSHQKDKVLAKALHAELEKFARPWYKPRVLRIFRDETNLSMTPNGWSTIQEALEKSGWFVLMASPTSAASGWVAKEVNWWMTNRSPDRMLLALTDGDIRWSGTDFDWTSTTALPGQLANRFREEPLWIDLRQLTLRAPTAAEAPSVVALGDMVAEFAAPIRNRPKDALIGAHLRLGKQIRRLIAGTVVALSLLSTAAVVAAVIANDQRRTAERQARVAKSQQLAANVEALLPRRLDLAQLLAVQAYRTDPNRQAEMSLWRAATASPALVRYAHMATPVTSVASSADARTAVVGTAGGEVVRWDVNTGDRRILGRLSGPVKSVASSADGTVMAAVSDNDGYVWAGPDLRATHVDRPSGATGLAVTVSPSGRFVSISAGPPTMHDTGMKQVRLIDRMSGRTQTSATTVHPAAMAMPSDAEVVVFNGFDTWERRPTADLDDGVKPRKVQIGAHATSTALSPNGSFFGFVFGGGPAPVFATTGEVATRDPGDLFFETRGSENEALAISPDGRTIAAAQAGTIYVARTVVDRETLPSAIEHPGNSTVGVLTFAGDSDHLLSSTGTAVALWNLNQRGRASTALATSIDRGCFGCEPPRVMVSPDARHVLVHSGTGTVTLRELSSTGTETRLVSDEGGYRLIGWSDDGSRWYVQAPNGTVEVRTPDDKAPVVQRWNNLAPYTILGLANGDTQAITLKEGNVELHDFHGGDVIRRFFTGVDYPEYVVVSPHGNKVHLRDGSSTIVDVATGERTVVGKGEAAALTFSGDSVIVQRPSGMLEIWDAEGTHLRHSLQQDKGYLATTPTFRTPPTFGGGLLVQQRSNGELTLIEVSDGTVLGTLAGTDYAKMGLALAPDGRSLITAEEGSSEPEQGSLVVWDLDPEAWAAAACRAAGRDLSAAERATYLNPIVRAGHTCDTKASPQASMPTRAPAAQAQKVSRVLQEMSLQRQSIRKPIDAAAQCAGDFDAHARELTEAGSAREYLSLQVVNFDTSDLPDGVLLKNHIRAALGISAAVDLEFAGWASGLRTGCSAGSAATNPRYARALALSQLATMEKEEVAKLWGPIAERYGYRQWGAVDI
jgi:WD40 repeat protein